LNELCKYARGQPTGTTSEICSNDTVVPVDFSTRGYWSSTSQGLNVWYRYFGSGNRAYDSKNSDYCVRPIRAF
jgi:hypothetical protein